MEIVLFGLLAVMLVFMFVNTRKRQKQLKAEQAEKAEKTVPGARVLMQGGIYGIIDFYDPENLDEPARVEIAPGVVIEVHSQAILRIAERTEATDEVDAVDEVSDTDALEDIAIETPEQTRARLDRDSDDK